MGEIVERLLEIALERGALKYGQFTLTSGRQSSYYFDGRLLSLDPEGAHLIGKALVPLLSDANVDAVGGPTLGAAPRPPDAGGDRLGGLGRDVGHGDARALVGEQLRRGSAHPAGSAGDEHDLVRNGTA